MTLRQPDELESLAFPLRTGDGPTGVTIEFTYYGGTCCYLNAFTGVRDTPTFRTLGRCADPVQLEKLFQALKQVRAAAKRQATYEEQKKEKLTLATPANNG